jgi:1-pyrroline-5-carboxylate dehydrogenase
VKGFSVPGDHTGQTSYGYRWPYGPVCVITPFNFPIEIPVLQMMGALFAGNKVLLKTDTRVALVMEQFLRLLEEAGLPAEDLDFINSDGHVAEKILVNGPFRLTQFTGSSKVAEHLSEKLRGKVILEDAGFDWKLLGPDVHDIDYVAWQSDQDAYSASGQKCSAQSILYAHKNWLDAGLVGKLKALAARRKIDDLTVGPVLTWNNEQIKSHIDKVLKIPGAKLEFGGQELTGHSIPKVYGSYQPTAVSVPLKEMIKPKNFKIATTELFGPFQIIATWEDGELDTLLESLEKMEHHLTAAVVSRDEVFRHKVLAHTVNGTTYSGIRARTTGAPQNHWFGPAGDPRGGGIGTPEAILKVWTCHREIITDIGPIVSDWKTPPSS